MSADRTPVPLSEIEIGASLGVAMMRLGLVPIRVGGLRVADRVLAQRTSLLVPGGSFVVLTVAFAAVGPSTGLMRVAFTDKDLASFDRDEVVWVMTKDCSGAPTLIKQVNELFFPEL